MSFEINKEQQLTLDDRFLQVDERTKICFKFMGKRFFRNHFPGDQLRTFSVLYSESKGSRPNNPVNAVVCSMILK